ncbi:Putative ubiquitin-conjugating enzyme E2 38 [Linum grandiflorum]
MSTPPPPAAAAAAVDFPRFDSVSDPSDHSFYSATKLRTSIPKTVANKIMQEWKILEKHLPDSISVRVYEDQIDILRAVIVGAAGTPYHDGLYFFDIAFPTDYPKSPPKVMYRSSGLRINPNLYANGRVCLSLINTWSGKKVEKWNPDESTILQVLLSIQGLVLNERPYFNEPGAGMFPGKKDRRSTAYNEDVFVLCCKTMLFLVRNPPRNFEGFVRSHFRERGVAILSAMRAYADGECRVGYYGTAEGEAAVKGEPSVKFKGWISQLQMELSGAFAKVGAPVGNFVEQLECEKAARVKKMKPEKKKKKTEKSGVVKRVLGKVKEILGLKKKKTTMASS